MIKDQHLVVTNYGKGSAGFLFFCGKAKLVFVAKEENRQNSPSAGPLGAGSEQRWSLGSRFQEQAWILQGPPPRVQGAFASSAQRGEITPRDEAGLK